MIHPTNPAAVRVKRDGQRGWHWVYPFDPAVHELYERAPLDHDGDGKKGGSLPKAQRAPRKKAAG